MKLSILIFLKSARISPAAFSLTFVNSLTPKNLLKLINSSKTCQAQTRVRIWLHLSYTELKSLCSKQEKRKRAERDERSRSANGKREREVRARRASADTQSTFDKTFGLCRRYLRPRLYQTFWLESQTSLLTPLTRFWQQAKAYQRNTFDTPLQGNSQVSKNGLYRLWSGWQSRS